MFKTSSKRRPSFTYRCFIITFQQFMVYSEKMHKMKTRAESVKVALERVRTGEEDIEDKSEELAVDVPETPGELDENSSQRTKETFAF